MPLNYGFLIFTAVFSPLLMQYAEGRSGIVIISFPRLVFGHFHDALVESRDVISNHGGIVEVLSYKILVYPNTQNSSLVNGTSQDRTRSICVLSFQTTLDAQTWLSTDPLVNRVDIWSYKMDVDIVLSSSALNRHYPFSLYMRAHIIVLLTPIVESAQFVSEVVPEMTRIYSKYGGNNLAMATENWQKIMGETWPANVTDWLFYGPVTDTDNVRTLMKSADVTKMVAAFPTALQSVQFYGMDSFFNTGSRTLISRTCTLIYMCSIVVFCKNII